jgi:small subunit ribosomal protein S1
LDSETPTIAEGNDGSDAAAPAAITSEAPTAPDAPSATPSAVTIPDASSAAPSAEAASPEPASASTAVEADEEIEETQVTLDDLDGMSLSDAIDATIVAFDDGDVVTGTVVKIDSDEVLLDIGYKSEGVIPSKELSIRNDVDPHEIVSLDDELEALVLQKEDKEGRLILSKKRAQYERAWGTIEELKEKDEPVEGTVIEVVKGGLILDIGLRGFLPASLVEMRRVRDLQPYVGRKIEAKIIELDKNRNNVVLSRRAWLEQTQSEVRHTFLNTLSKGQIRKGVVSSIVNFGAFVDLGGVDGLVHVSELSWKHIDHPGEVVEVGQEVTVEVLDVDMDRERVSLSLKSTQEDPWQQFARTHQIGQVVPGRVTKLVPFGAFVRVEEGIEGLVHISELADRHVEIPEQVVQVGDEIFVKIIDIDLDRRRISLSLKQANEGTIGEAVGDDFDPTLYGMPASYDEQGNYEYPEGFDPETGEWLPGYEKQREEWEHQYAEARARFEAHRRQVEESRAKADEEEATGGEVADSGAANGAPRASRGSRAGGPRQGGTPGAVTSTSTPGAGATGTLASDEALAALREKLSGGQS